MLTLLSPDFSLEEVTQDDMVIASLVLGFTLGFGWLTTWRAIKHTQRTWRMHGTRTVHNTYLWLIWLEILVCLTFGITCFLYLRGFIPPRRAILPSSACERHRVHDLRRLILVFDLASRFTFPSRPFGHFRFSSSSKSSSPDAEYCWIAIR